MDAFQFALFTFPDEIYLVGCDVTSSDENVLRQKINYSRLKTFAARGVEPPLVAVGKGITSTE